MMYSQRSHFSQRLTELLKDGYMISKNVSDDMRELRRARHTLIQPDSFDYTTLNYFAEFVLSTFPDNNALTEKAARSL